MIRQQQISIDTGGRGTYNITREVNDFIADCGIETGLCNVFCHHTSASLILCENADPDVRVDLESWMARAVKDGDAIFRHTLEGPDDMSAHIRSILTDCSLNIPVSHGRSGLGTWQGVFLWEHRTGRFARKVTLTVQG